VHVEVIREILLDRCLDPVDAARDVDEATARSETLKRAAEAAKAGVARPTLVRERRALTGAQLVDGDPDERLVRGRCRTGRRRDDLRREGRCGACGASDRALPDPAGAREGAGEQLGSDVTRLRRVDDVPVCALRKEDLRARL